MRSTTSGAILVALLLGMHAGLLAWGAYRHSPTVDEVGHLAAGITHWRLGRFDLYRVNPPLVRMVAALPVLAQAPVVWDNLPADDGERHEFELGRSFIEVNGFRSFWWFTLARWACIPFSLLGGYVCWRWARELYGPRASWLALLLWCFCPNILGNAQMITPDTGAAALGTAACFAFWHWLRHPSWSQAILAGVALGAAELTKLTWVVLFALWPLLWVFWRWHGRRSEPRRAWAGEAGQLGLTLLLGLFVVNLGYGFEGSCQRLGTYRFLSAAFTGSVAPDEAASGPRNRFAGSWLGDVPVPVPRNYLLGIDMQKNDFDSKMRSYLDGEWRLGGWWYFYLYGLAIKVPLGTWVLVLLAGWLTVAYPRASAGWANEAVVLAPVAVVLILVSSQTGFNHHLRYVLPIFPFAFIWVSKVARAWEWAWWRTALVAGAALAGSVASSLAVYPHSLSYFNELVGGPANGHAHLVDSNIDWGQDLLLLKEWLDAHPEAHPLGLAYFGYFDPRVAGIEFTLPPKGPTRDSELRSPASLGPQPGWFAISVTLLRGYHYPIADGQGELVYLGEPSYVYFQRFRPVAMAGYSIYLYHIRPEEADRVREDLGLPRLGSARTEVPGK